MNIIVRGPSMGFQILDKWIFVLKAPLCTFTFQTLNFLANHLCHGPEILPWALIQYEQCPYKKRKFRDRHTERTSCEDQDRDQSDASTSHGVPVFSSKPPEARREAWNKFFFSQSSKGITSADTFISDFQPPKQWDNKFQLFKSLSLWYFAMATVAN